MSGNRGQVGLEYAALVGLVLLVALPLAYYAFEGANMQARIVQAEIAVDKIASAADFVASAGRGAKVTVSVDFPAGIENASAGGREVQMLLRSADGKIVDVYSVTNANISSVTLPTHEGKKVFVLSYPESGDLLLQRVEDVASSTSTTTTTLATTSSSTTTTSTTTTTLTDSTAPPAPALLSPANASSGNRTPVFGWNASPDVSQPVRYLIQVDQGMGFDEPLDVDENPYATGYAVENTLQNNKQFYWRVRATDGAGNVGAWSEVWWYHT